MTRLLLLAIAACAQVQPSPTPAHAGIPPEMWSRCPMICEAQSGLFLGVLMPAPEGPPICACAKKPETSTPKAWDT